MADRHHARLMAALQAAEQAVQGLIQRPREPLILTQTLRSVIDEINERARTLRYGLLILVAERATDLVMAMLRNPGAAMHTSATIAPALGTLVTAMKRVGYNRMEGDGGEAGLKLLEMIDGIVAPARARLG
jgi:hypothetical protein